MKNLIIALLLHGALWGPDVFASDALPDKDRVYADSDVAARATGVRQGGKAEYRRQLNLAIQQNPRNVIALCNRGYVRSLAGDYSGANEDYIRALANADPKSAKYRHILWSLGWSQFNVGDDNAALLFWERAEQHHGGSPYWVPYTVAISYWRLGEKEKALAYYHLAVKSNPDWGTDAGVEKMTSHWKKAEKKVHVELFAEYKKQNTKSQLFMNSTL